MKLLSSPPIHLRKKLFSSLNYYPVFYYIPISSFTHLEPKAFLTLPYTYHHPSSISRGFTLCKLPILELISYVIYYSP